MRKITIGLGVIALLGIAGVATAQSTGVDLNGWYPSALKSLGEIADNTKRLKTIEDDVAKIKLQTATPTTPAMVKRPPFQFTASPQSSSAGPSTISCGSNCEGAAKDFCSKLGYSKVTNQQVVGSAYLTGLVCYE
jgi:hypothetical protein